MLRNRPIALLLTLAALPAVALTVAPATGVAATKLTRCDARRRAGAGRRTAPCRQTTRRHPRGWDFWRELAGDEFEFDEVQISGTMSASEASGADFLFDASSSTTISPLRRRITDETPWVTTAGGRFAFTTEVVPAVASPVLYRSSATATIEYDGEVRGCPLPPGLQQNGPGRLSVVFAWDEERNRVAASWQLYTGGWQCDTTVVPSCGHTRGGDAGLMFYKEIEFTRRWIRLPIDLQYSISEDATCSYRWNGWVKLRKLRDGR